MVAFDFFNLGIDVILVGAPLVVDFIIAQLIVFQKFGFWVFEFWQVPKFRVFRVLHLDANANVKLGAQFLVFLINLLLDKGPKFFSLFSILPRIFPELFYNRRTQKPIFCKFPIDFLVNPKQALTTIYQVTNQQAGGDLLLKEIIYTFDFAHDALSHQFLTNQSFPLIVPVDPEAWDLKGPYAKVPISETFNILDNILEWVIFLV